MDSDPLAVLLQPPPNESIQDREKRLEQEKLAKQRSDEIDQELHRQRVAEKKGSRPVKILLLGQSESGKSTTLKNFQLINDKKAFDNSKKAWRCVVHLNVVRSIRLILNAVAEAEAYTSDSAAPDDPVYPPLPSELRALKMRLLPLQQVEAALLGKLANGAASTFKSDGPDGTPASSELAIHSSAPWKGAFNRLMNNMRSSVDGPETELQDSKEARQLLHACSEDMRKLWADPTVKDVLRVHRLRLEDMAGFFLDSIERVTDLAYEPTDDDILKARLKTLGVSEHRFTLRAGNMLPQSWTVYDVGGARSLRAAWVPYFDTVDCIIFLAPLSAFDQVLAEDETVNRLEDSTLIWKLIVSNALLKNTNIILFLNKCDILKAKLASGQRFADYVVSYGDRVNGFEEISQYMKKKFNMIAKSHSPEPRGFYTYFTSVTNSQSTSDILGSVRDMLVRQNLAKSRLV